MADNTQGVTGMSGKLVTQPSLPSNAASDPGDESLVCQAPRSMGKISNRSTMNLVTQAKLPGSSKDHAPTKGSGKS